MMHCVDSVNASRLTTLIIAGCENVTDTFLLTSFLSDIPAEVNLLNGTPVSSVCEAPGTATAAAGSCQTVNGSSQPLSCHTLNRSDVSALFRRNCAAAMCSKELCSAMAFSCARKWSIDSGSDHAGTALLPVSAVDRGTARRCQTTVNGSRMNRSTVACTRMTCDKYRCTNKTYKLEHLDISGCWKITDLSIRSV